MRVVIQRVKSAQVTVNHQTIGQIHQGFLLFVGFKDTDGIEELNYIAKKVAKMRLFEDEQGKMNLDLKAVGGDILSISQFTLLADTRKGNRPSFIRAQDPKYAKQNYLRFNQLLRDDYNLKVEEGEFGADMKIELLNDGPVTIILDTDNK